MPGAAAPTVWVVGSLNVDLVLAVDRIAAPGETVLATDVSRGCGGKGANQAVAAARAGAPTRMVGCVGEDDGGDLLLGHLAAEGVAAAGVSRAGPVTGLAVVSVDPAGANAITVAPGANALCTVAHVEEAMTDLAATDVVVAQLEVPLEVVEAAARAASRTGATFVLNLAPSTHVASSLLDRVDVLVVNEHEAADLLADLGLVATGGEAATALARRLGGTVVVTLGGAGAAVATPRHHWRAPAVAPPSVVDTTGAGDAFVGALAAALASGRELAEAVRWGTAAGCIAVAAPGAQGGRATPEAIARLVGTSRPDA